MGRFETTRWSLVLASGLDAPQAREALARLCAVYRIPVLAYLRQHGYAPEDAEDLTQGFFLKFIEHAYHAEANPERGRFRSFLLAAVQHYVAHCRDHARAAKRGGSQVHESLDGDHSTGLATNAEEAPERVFERAWARAVIDQAIVALRQEACAAGKSVLFDRLREFLIEQPEEHDYARVAAELAMSRNTLAVAVRRMRLRLRELVRVELTHTVAQAADVDNEVRVLRQVLGGDG